MKIRTQLIAGFSMLTAIMAVMQIMALKTQSTATETEKWVTHTYTVIGDARRVEKLMLNMETGERGFLITGNEEFLEPYHEAQDRYVETMEELKKLVSDNPPQVERLDRIDNLIAQWRETVAEPIIAERRKITHEPAGDDPAGASPVSRKDIETFVGSGIGKTFMDEIRNKTEEFISIEEELLKTRHLESHRSEQRSRKILISGTVLFLIGSILSLVIILRSILGQVGGEPGAIAAITNRIAKGDFDVDSPTGSETGILASVHVMLKSLKKNQEEIQKQNWLNEGIAGLDDAMRGTKAMDVLCEDIISFVARYLDVQVGTLSLTSPDGSRLTLAGRYAYKERPDMPTEFRLGEGLIGQAAQEKKRILMKNVPENSFTITSALGEILPESIVCCPLLYAGKVNGVIELGSLRPFTPPQLEFLDHTAERMAIAINTALARERMKVLLEESQAQAEELQTQQEELRTANEELEQKRQELETQQEELRVSNEELEQKNAEMRAREEQEKR